MEAPCESFSILTPSYNQGRYIERTIRSVMAQNYSNVQHIVVDGASTDGTLDILRSFPHLTWTSEKDSGQADALNKALALATGDVIGWINSDDYYCENIFGSVIQHFHRTNADWLVGNLSLVFEDDTATDFRASPVVTRQALMRYPDIVRQQSTFFRRTFINTAGGWDIS